MYLHCLGAGSGGVNIWHRSSGLVQMLALHKNGEVKKPPPARMYARAKTMRMMGVWTTPLVGKGVSGHGAGRQSFQTVWFACWGMRAVRLRRAAY